MHADLKGTYKTHAENAHPKYISIEAAHPKRWCYQTLRIMNYSPAISGHSYYLTRNCLNIIFSSNIKILK
jgi:hypothetical protein